MKKPINIYRRYRKPIKYKSVMAPMTAIMVAMGSSRIAAMAATPFYPHDHSMGAEEKKQLKSNQMAKSAMETAFGVVKVHHFDRIRRFNETGEYGRGKFNFNKEKEAYEKAISLL